MVLDPTDIGGRVVVAVGDNPPVAATDILVGVGVPLQETVNLEALVQLQMVSSSEFLSPFEFHSILS
jgi:hypothetical protein